MKKKLESGFEINTMMENHDKNIKCVHDSFSEAFSLYQNTQDCSPLLMCGDALQLLSHIPSDSIDFIMTSPPYWGKREYENGGIGLETEYMDFVRNLADICLQIKRVLKPTGSFWLNLGDTYKDKALLGLPWRVAFELTDNQGWILRNSVIWNKLKGGMDNSTDRLGKVRISGEILLG
ncbi:site-specific DNA-methyltransferase [Aeromonas caviae]|nr:DNA methyltransferase [Aeromonas caviae]MDH0435974.1 site-specific DNA-methyltransferase [Aeromonas caviae]MDH0938820.1 site-specific DNA-methyltransferase [Aeromonas caviae]MDH1399653.1 site-specific DNA-methyltransferase [Aeromonas caviae]MDH1806763.1 site-specific DNA-methyltransferase [Aeromonas caviae]RWT34073.1 hypothetical protein DN613_20135 [Aeromonas caviae]